MNQITEFIMKHAGLAGYEKAVNVVQMKAEKSQAESSARKAASVARGRVAKVASKKRQKRASK